MIRGAVKAANVGGVAKMTEGRRRVDRVLDAGFVVDLDQVDDADLLNRRDEALQEESDVSYTRRLIQGRLDLLRFEVKRRTLPPPQRSGSAKQDDAALVKALAGVLAEPSAGSERATGPQVRPVPLGAGVEPQVSVYSRRAAESAVADVRFSDLRSLSSEELEDAIELFEGLEAEVSQTRFRLQRVADAIVAEVETRVAAGTMTMDAL